MSTDLETFFKNQGLRPMGTLAHFGVLGMKWGIRKSESTRPFALSYHPEENGTRAPKTGDVIPHPSSSTGRIKITKIYAEDRDAFTGIGKDTNEPLTKIFGNLKGNVIDSELEQSGLVGEFISHWGIKGMKWGIRRSDDELARLRGGLDEAGDAARARQTQQAISKAKSLAAVSDADLNHLVNRLNLEKRYVDIKAATSVSAKTNSKIKTLLGFGETMNKAVAFYDSEAGRILAGKLGFVKPSAGKHIALPGSTSSAKALVEKLKKEQR